MKTFGDFLELVQNQGQAPAQQIGGRLGGVNTPMSMDVAQDKADNYVGGKKYSVAQIARALADYYHSLIANDPQGQQKGEQALQLFWQQRKNFNQQQPSMLSKSVAADAQAPGAQQPSMLSRPGANAPVAQAPQRY